jgi:hypothetical protein
MLILEPPAVVEPVADSACLTTYALDGSERLSSMESFE